LNYLKKITYHPYIIKLLHWEYWSFNVVYGPIYFYWLWLALKSRSLFFFNAANPSIENGGFLLESKSKIYELIPKEYYPKTVYLKKGCTAVQAHYQMERAGLTFPVIAKPDIGGRGRMVNMIRNETELNEYIESIKENFLIQGMVDWELEVGIFYYRYPNEARGYISGIVSKEFLSVVGDGKSSIEELLNQNKRFVLQLSSLKKTYGKTLETVLSKNEKRILVPYGNHARGSKFIDASGEIDETLTKTIDDVCKKIAGFYFGRLDIKFNSWEELRQGKNFSIIELNGSGSEPTHIYDPRHSIFFAWKEIIRHWKLLQRISVINHKRNYVPYMSYKEGMQMLRDNKAHLRLTAENN
jgi:hypothetical protein